MSISHKYLDDGGVLIKVDGDLVVSEVAELNRTIYETPEKTRAIVYQICDFRNVEKLIYSPDDIVNLAAQDNHAAELNPGMLIAIVGEDDLIFGLSRMWEGHINNTALNTAVFRTMEACEAWIAARTGSHPPKPE